MKAAFIRWCEGHVVSTSIISTLVIMVLLFMGVLPGCSVRVEPRQEADALKAEVVTVDAVKADELSPAKPGFTIAETDVEGLLVVRDPETGCEYLATRIGGSVGGLTSLQPRGKACA